MAAVAVPLLDEAVYVASFNVDLEDMDDLTIFIEGATAVQQPDAVNGARLAVYTIASAVHSVPPPPGTRIHNLAIVEKAPWLPGGFIRCRVSGTAANGFSGELQIGAYALVQARVPIPLDYRISKEGPGSVLVQTRTS